ncbi:hypothetical protein C8F04DRAFT_1060007, partial [Mycena alexandri]
MLDFGQTSLSWFSWLPLHLHQSLCLYLSSRFCRDVGPCQDFVITTLRISAFTFLCSQMRMVATIAGQLESNPGCYCCTTGIACCQTNMQSCVVSTIPLDGLQIIKQQVCWSFREFGSNKLPTTMFTFATSFYPCFLCLSILQQLCADPFLF